MNYYFSRCKFHIRMPRVDALLESNKSNQLTEQKAKPASTDQGSKENEIP